MFKLEDLELERLKRISSAPSRYWPTLASHSATLPYACCFAPENFNSLLAVGDETGSVSIVDTNNVDYPTQTFILDRFQAHGDCIYDIKWHPTSMKMVPMTN